MRDAILGALAAPALSAGLRRGAREAYVAAAARQHVDALARALVDVVQRAAS